LPALGRDQRLLQSEVGDDGGLIHVVGNLLGAALRGDVLGPGELRAPTQSRQAQQIAGDQGDGPSGALLPRRVGG
jgi:hypothetical protein